MPSCGLFCATPVCQAEASNIAAISRDANCPIPSISILSEPRAVWFSPTGGQSTGRANLRLYRFGLAVADLFSPLDQALQPPLRP